MPGPKRTAAAAATLAFSAVPLPLASWGHPPKQDRIPARPAPVTAANTPHTPAAPARTRQSPVAPTRTPHPPVAPARTPHPPVAPARTWSTSHRAHIQHDLRLRRTPKPRSPLRPRAHTTGDPANTITDFKFSPGTTTVHVGDTVTWTNSGPSPHTATANDGSFDTGTLAKGASASHTFTHSGSFAYICKIHPFMKGTVVVLAAATTSATNNPSSSGGATNSTGASPSTAAAASGTAGNAATSNAPTLPVTGLDVPALLAVGLGLLALGRLVRRRVI